MNAGEVSLVQPHTPLDDEGFYTPAEVARLTGVSRDQLRNWKRKGVIAPNVEVEDFDGDTEHGYSFEYLVYVGLLRRLLRQGYTLNRSVRGLKHLRDRFGPPGPEWFRVRLAFDGSGFVAFKDDQWVATVATSGGQKLAEKVVAIDFAEFGNRLDAVIIPAEFLPFVEMDPAVRDGMPVMRGTTIRTNVVYRLSLDGLSPEAIQHSYPKLTIEQISRAIEYERSLDGVR